MYPRGVENWTLPAGKPRLESLPAGDFADGEPIFHPFGTNPQDAVAHLVAGRADKGLDCAAARVVPGHETRSWLLELGRPGPIVQPRVGMRVIKSGIKTGVTEGEIVAITGDVVEIRAPQGYPGSYDLSQRGDSGSIWCSCDIQDGTLPMVALHTGGNVTGPEKAHGVLMEVVFRQLGLQRF